MAMTKKERVEYLRVVRDLRIRTALRFTSRVRPDLPVPKYSNSSDLTRGWVPIGTLGNYARVDIACSSSAFHAVGQVDRTTSQRPIPMYSTKLLALLGLRNEMELRCAEELARIDEQIEKAEQEGNGTKEPA